MKKYLIISILALAMVSCDSFTDIYDAEKIEPITVNVELDISVENLATLQNLTLKMDNYEEAVHYEKEFSGNVVQMPNIIPGIYTINITGTALDIAGNEYYVNGSEVNKALLENDQSLSLLVQGLKVSPLVFKEIYYAGCRTPLGAVYFRDQFYELYNNSSSVIYLDGLYFANLTPGRASTTLPVWPEADGNKYAYAERVWRFPGTGTDYPLQPGESCVLAQFAANHQLDQYNPASPVNTSIAEFEFNMDNASFPDQPAMDMEHVFYNGKAEKGTTKQYLTSVFGGAYVIFQVPEGETWDPVGDKSMSTTDLSTTKNTLYAKIPIKYVLDAVEAVDNESKMSAKRVPGVLDAGITWVGATYCGLGVCRKISTDDDGNPILRNGLSYIYQDTNNSTDDFERGVVPELRRNEALMPSWNHTLK